MTVVGLAVSSLPPRVSRIADTPVAAATASTPPVARSSSRRRLILGGERPTPSASAAFRELPQLW